MALETEPPPASGGRASAPGAATEALVIGLVNNMPDSALEGTEQQFTRLLGAAAARRRVRLRFSFLPEVPRGAEARAWIDARYWTLPELLQGPLDALIVTGTEPRSPSLREEPYWNRLAQLLEFAERSTISSIWSCLAAHAAALHLDGVERVRFSQKLCGVYAHSISGDHPLTSGLSSPLLTPHSRWNTLPIERLREAGYTLLAQSSVTGADLFVKSGRSLRVFMQGHPEYEERTLLKEYQRDVGRFINGVQPVYPTMPVGYFSAEGEQALLGFEREVRAGRIENPLEAFPFKAVSGSLSEGWRGGAARVYENWLDLVASRKATAPALAGYAG
jgi:homoserine O-succinyltransferase